MALEWYELFVIVGNSEIVQVICFLRVVRIVTPLDLHRQIVGSPLNARTTSRSEDNTLDRLNTLMVL